MFPGFQAAILCHEEESHALRIAEQWQKSFWQIGELPLSVVAVTQSCLTLCDPMNWSTPGFPLTAAAAAKLLQSCPTLCNPIDSSPPGSPIPGILQARTMEWVAISFSNAWKWKVKVKSLSRVQLLATPWTAAYQAPLSMGFSRQEYWSGVPLPSPFTTVSQFAQTHIQWCHPTVSSCHPLLLLPSNFPSIRVFSSKSALCIRWPKYWSFSFSINSSNEYADFL